MANPSVNTVTLALPPAVSELQRTLSRLNTQLGKFRSSKAASSTVSKGKKKRRRGKSKTPGLGANFARTQKKVEALKKQLAPLQQVFNKVTGAGQQFVDIMDDMGQSGHYSQQAVSQLSATAERLGMTSGYSATTTAGAMRQLQRAGMDAGQVLTTLPAVIDLATASHSKLAATAAGTSAVMKQFSLNTGQSGHVADVLATTMQVSGAKLQPTVGFLNDIAGAAQKAGMGFADTAAMSGLFNKVGVTSQQASSAIARFYQQVNVPGSTANATLQKLGISATTSGGQLRSMTAIIDDESKATQGMSAAEQQQAMTSVLGNSAGTAVQGLAAQTGGEGISAFSQVVNDYQGQAATATQTFAGRLQQLQAMFNTAGSALGARLLPFVEQAKSAFAEIQAQIQGWIAEHGALISAIQSGYQTLVKFSNFIKQMRETIDSLKLVGQLAKSAFGTVGNYASKAMGQLRAFSGAILRAVMGLGRLNIISKLSAVSTAIMTAAQWAFNAAMLANPITLIIAAIIAVVATITVVIFQKFAAVRNFFSGLWNGIVNGLKAVWQTITGIFSWSPLSALVKAWGTAIKWLKDKFSWITSIFDWFGDDDDKEDEDSDKEDKSGKDHRTRPKRQQRRQLKDTANNTQQRTQQVSRKAVASQQTLRHQALVRSAPARQAVSLPSNALPHGFQQDPKTTSPVIGQPGPAAAVAPGHGQPGSAVVLSPGSGLVPAASSNANAPSANSSGVQIQQLDIHVQASEGMDVDQLAEQIQQQFMSLVHEQQAAQRGALHDE